MRHDLLGVLLARALVCHLLIHYLMVVHARMPCYTISVTQRSKSSIYHQNNHPNFLDREYIYIYIYVYICIYIYIFVLGLLSL
jgi:hypothetical protein